MTDTRIARLHGRRVWDSRGRPTVEVEVTLGCGANGRAIAPAGASTGTGEAVDLRDGGTALGGFGVRRAVSGVNDEIAAELRGLDADDQAEIDARLIRLDGTPNRSRLGGNALVATSIAVLQARAAAARVPLWRHLAGSAPVRMPLPEIQIFGGGAHAARRVDIQDFMVVCPAAASFAEALDWTAEIYRAAGGLMKRAGKLQGVADEGGYWPAFASNEEALDTLLASIEAAGFRPGRDVLISLDVAASEFGRGGALPSGARRARTRYRRHDRPARRNGSMPIRSHPSKTRSPRTTRRAFAAFTRLHGNRCQIVGDDYLVTNAERVAAAGVARAVNAVLIKPNQAGTITESHAALEAARRAGFGTIVSARSGETEDVTIAHLAVGWNAGQIKVGSFSRSERMAKWNECLRIEEELGARAPFAGWSVLPASWKQDA